MNIKRYKNSIKLFAVSLFLSVVFVSAQNKMVVAQQYNTQAETLLLNGFGSMYLPCIKDPYDSVTAADEYLDGKSTTNYNIRTACVHVSNTYSSNAGVTVNTNAFELYRLLATIQPLYNTFESSNFTVGAFDREGATGYTCKPSDTKCVTLRGDNKFAAALKYVYQSGTNGTVGNACLDYTNKRCCEGTNCGVGWQLGDTPDTSGTCLDGSVCYNVRAVNSSPTPTNGPTPTPLPLPTELQDINATSTPAPTEPPQDDCAGEIDCECKRIFPGNDGLGLYGGAAESIRKGPLIGDVLKNYVYNTSASIANAIMGTGNQTPPDMATPEQGKEQVMLFEYASSCKSGAICARTRNIGMHLDPNNPPNIQGDDICVSDSNLSWGSYVRKKGESFYASKLQKDSRYASIFDNKTSIFKVAAGGLGSADTLKTDEIKTQLADVCFRQIPYSNRIVDTITKPVWPDWMLEQLNNEYTDQYNNQPIQEILIGSMGYGFFGDLNKSFESSLGGILFRLAAWTRNKVGVGFHSGIYANFVYGDPKDYAYLHSKCSTTQTYTLPDDGGTIEIPASCSGAPTSGKVGKDLIMKMNNDIVAKHGIPSDKVQGIKASLAQCLDCAHEGKISTAIGCIPVNNVQQFITEFVFKIGIGIAGSFSILCIIYGAILFQTSQGNSTQVQKARKIIVSCVVGLLIIIFSLFIFRFIGIDILRIPGLE